MSRSWTFIILKFSLCPAWALVAALYLAEERWGFAALYALLALAWLALGAAATYDKGRADGYVIRIITEGDGPSVTNVRWSR